MAVNTDKSLVITQRTRVCEMKKNKIKISNQKHEKGHYINDNSQNSYTEEKCVQILQKNDRKRNRNNCKDKILKDQCTKSSKLLNGSNKTDPQLHSSNSKISDNRKATLVTCNDLNLTTSAQSSLVSRCHSSLTNDIYPADRIKPSNTLQFDFNVTKNVFSDDYHKRKQFNSRNKFEDVIPIQPNSRQLLSNTCNDETIEQPTDVECLIQNRHLTNKSKKDVSHKRQRDPKLHSSAFKQVICNSLSSTCGVPVSAHPLIHLNGTNHRLTPMSHHRPIDSCALNGAEEIYRKDDVTSSTTNDGCTMQYNFPLITSNEYANVSKPDLENCSQTFADVTWNRCDNTMHSSDNRSDLKFVYNNPLLTSCDFPFMPYPAPTHHIPAILSTGLYNSKPIDLSMSAGENKKAEDNPGDSQRTLLEPVTPPPAHSLTVYNNPFGNSLLPENSGAIPFFPYAPPPQQWYNYPIPLDSLLLNGYPYGFTNPYLYPNYLNPSYVNSFILNNSCSEGVASAPVDFSTKTNTLSDFTSDRDNSRILGVANVSSENEDAGKVDRASEANLSSFCNSSNERINRKGAIPVGIAVAQQRFSNIEFDNDGEKMDSSIDKVAEHATNSINNAEEWSKEIREADQQGNVPTPNETSAKADNKLDGIPSSITPPICNQGGDSNINAISSQPVTGHFLILPSVTSIPSALTAVQPMHLAYNTDMQSVPHLELQTTNQLSQNLTSADEKPEMMDCGGQKLLPVFNDISQMNVLTSQTPIQFMTYLRDLNSISSVHQNMPYQIQSLPQQSSLPYIYDAKLIHLPGFPLTSGVNNVERVESHHDAANACNDISSIQGLSDPTGITLDIDAKCASNHKISNYKFLRTNSTITVNESQLVNLAANENDKSLLNSKLTEDHQICSVPDNYNSSNCVDKMNKMSGQPERVCLENKDIDGSKMFVDHRKELNLSSDSHISETLSKITCGNPSKIYPETPAIGERKSISTGVGIKFPHPDITKDLPTYADYLEQDGCNNSERYQCITTKTSKSDLEPPSNHYPSNVMNLEEAEVLASLADVQLPVKHYDNSLSKTEVPPQVKHSEDSLSKAEVPMHLTHHDGDLFKGEELHGLELLSFIAERELCNKTKLSSPEKYSSFLSSVSEGYFSSESTDMILSCKSENSHNCLSPSSHKLQKDESTVSNEKLVRTEMAKVERLYRHQKNKLSRMRHARPNQKSNKKVAQRRQKNVQANLPEEQSNSNSVKIQGLSFSNQSVKTNVSDSDSSDNLTSATKKRKPGRPQKRNSLKKCGVTETIFSKNSTGVGMIDMPHVNIDSAMQREIKLDGKTPLKPIFLEEEWFRRRSERIFLSDSSPQTSPNSLLSSPGSLKSSVTSSTSQVSHSPNNFHQKSYPYSTNVLPHTHKFDQSHASILKIPEKVTVQRPSTDSDSAIDDVPLSHLRTNLPKCKLKKSDLKDEARVLLFVDGLFYEGCVKEITPPDVYGVIIDGERGHKPHILSQEEILREAIQDIEPDSAEELGIGTRVCAYWSDQFSCLHPGRVSEGSPVSGADEILVCVEFDDGDSGKIPLSLIRYLPPDFPIVCQESQPILTLCTRRKRGVSNDSETSKSRNSSRSPQRLHSVSRPLEHGHLQSNSDVEDDVFSAGSVFTFGNSNRKFQTFSEVSRSQKESTKCRIQKNSLKPFKSNWWNTSESLCSTTMSSGGHQLVRLSKAQSKQNGFISKCKLLFSAPKNTLFEGPKVPSKMQKRKLESSISTQPSKDSRCGPTQSFNQEWVWLGKGTRRPGMKGRAKKEYYKAIKRGSEVIKVGDYAVFISLGRPTLPYVGKIKYMWESWCGKMVVKVMWLYHPEEAKGSKLLLYPKGALYQSCHSDENNVQTISHSCEVVSLMDYKLRVAQAARSRVPIKRNTLFYLAGEYDPTFGIVTYKSGVL